MRRRARRGSWLSILVPLALLAGTGLSDESKEADDGLDVYFRDMDLSALSDQDLARYPEVEAGESLTLPRAFPDAPPQISHSVEDLLPITSDDNECLECHHPDNVASEEEAPLPESHFQRPVFAMGKTEDPMIWVVTGYERAEDVVRSRYNCDMCHTPQAEGVKTPRSRFLRVEIESSR